MDGRLPLRVCIAGPAGSGKSSLARRLRRAAPKLYIEDTGPESWLPAAAASDILLLVADARDDIAAVLPRYAAAARNMGVGHLVVACNKADLAGWNADGFRAAADTLLEVSSRFEFASASLVPTCALSGENVEESGPQANSFAGPTLLDSLQAACRRETDRSMRPAQEQRKRTGRFAGRIVCLSDEPLLPGREYRLSTAGQDTRATLTTIKYRLDADTLERSPARHLMLGEIGACVVAAAAPVAISDFSASPSSGRFTLSDRLTGGVVGAGIVDFALRRGMNIHPQKLAVDKHLRAGLKRQVPCIVWFTGLSGAGKSTIANLVERRLALLGFHTYMLDGDNVRHGLNKDLGFTAADRVENIRRVGEVARLFVDAGLIVLCSFISPFRAERSAVRSLVGKGEFMEVHVSAPLEVCEQRDEKGLYAKSRAGRLPNFTGIDSPYEEPEAPDLVLDTTSRPPAELAEQVVALLRLRGHLQGRPADAPSVEGRRIRHEA